VRERSWEERTVRAAMLVICGMIGFSLFSMRKDMSIGIIVAAFGFLILSILFCMAIWFILQRIEELEK